MWSRRYWSDKEGDFKCLNAKAARAPESVPSVMAKVVRRACSPNPSVPNVAGQGTAQSAKARVAPDPEWLIVKQILLTIVDCLRGSANTHNPASQKSKSASGYGSTKNRSPS